MAKIVEPQRLLHLPAKILRSGEGRSLYDDTAGIWKDAIGLNPFLASDASRFLLATTAAPTQVGSSSITDIPIAYAKAPISSNNLLCLLGSGGRFYTIDDSNSVNVIRPGATTLVAISLPTGGMEYLTDSGGNSYVFLCTRTALIRWDLNTADSTTHWNESNALNSSNFHPIHYTSVAQAAYFGNGNYLGSIPTTELLNQATTLSTVTFQLMHFGSEEVTAISDDGRYTLVALSHSFDETTNFKYDARIIWYPNVGTNWDWEVTIKGERAIRAIIKNSLGVFAVGANTIYQLAFGQQPKIIDTFDSTDKVGGAFNAIAQNVGPRVDLAQPIGETLMAGIRGMTYGKLFPTEKVSFSHPLQGHTSNISMIAADFLTDHIYVGTEDSKLWDYNMGTAGNTTGTHQTNWMDLGQEAMIQRIDIEMPAGIATSDVLGVTVETPDGKTASVTLSQAAVSSGKRNFIRKALKPTLRGAQVRLSFTPSAGAPKFGGISLYGQPTAE